jgi:hypothetical protein
MAALAPSPTANSSSSNQKAALRPNTRQRFQPMGSVNAAFATQQSITNPQVGLVSRYFLYANLSIVDSAPAPNTPAGTYGPFNLLKRFQVVTNLGTATVVDTSGYGMFLIDKLTDTCIDTAVNNADVTADVFYNVPTSLVQNVAKAVQFVLMIPVAVNDGPQFQIGLLNAQAPEIRITLNFQFGTSADLFPGSTTAATQTLGGTVSAWYQYYEVPNPDQVQLPPRVLHRLLEDRQAIVATGDFNYVVPRQGVVLQILHTVTLNGARSLNTTDVTGRRLVFNKTDTPYNLNYIDDRIYNRFRYGLSGAVRDVPAGTYVWDFFDADQAPTRGDLRDAVDSEALSTLESYVTLSTTATLGAGNNFLDTVRRITQQY